MSLGHNFGQIALHTRTTRRLQTKSNAIHSGDRYEDEADSIAEQVTRSLRSAEAAQSKGPLQISDVPRSIQQSPDDRSAVNAETSSSAAGAETAPATETKTPPKAAARSLIVEDDAREIGVGQMRKTEFLDQMEREVCAAADAELVAVGHTAQGCPYVRNWLAFYRNRSSRHIERALQHYAPEATGASSAKDYIPFVTARVSRSAAIWATTGRITGVPAELAGQVPGAGLLGAVGSLLSGAAGMLGGMLGGIGRAVGGIFAKSREGGAVQDADAAQIQSQLGSGQSMDSGVRSRMEPAFGHDFSRVRIHADSRAAELSSGLNARAFTIGSNIAFAAGDYQPGTPVGDALLAHELAHVVQQSAANTQSAATTAPATDSLEAEADDSAEEAVLSLWEPSAEAGGSLEREVATRKGNQRHRSGSRTGLQLQRCSSDKQPAATPKPGGKPPVKTETKEETKDEKKEEKPEEPQLSAMDNAAIGGLTAIFCKTQKTGHEWCGNIFRTAEGGFRVSGPYEGGKSLCGKVENKRDDERLVAYYHSHPQGETLDFSNEGEMFGVGQGSQSGPKDIQEADAKGIDYYLINSNGEMKRYSPPAEKGIGTGRRKSLGKIDPKC